MDSTYKTLALTEEETFVLYMSLIEIRLLKEKEVERTRNQHLLEDINILKRVLAKIDDQNAVADYPTSKMNWFKIQS